MEKMCVYTPSQHALLNCKCVLRFCAILPYVYFTDQELNHFHTTTCPTICFHVYNIIKRRTLHGRLPLEGKEIVVCVMIILRLSHLQNSIQ